MEKRRKTLKNTILNRKITITSTYKSGSIFICGLISESNHSLVMSSKKLDPPVFNVSGCFPLKMTHVYEYKLYHTFGQLFSTCFFVLSHRSAFHLLESDTFHFLKKPRHTFAESC